jgi:outer membrane immunogenic protein
MKRIIAAGMLSLVAAGQALAADLARPLPPSVAYRPPVVPFYSWSGFYLGINGGGAFGNSNWTDPLLGSTGNFHTSGGLIGGTVGANYQMGAFVIGIEGDGDWTNLKGTETNICGLPGCETKSDWLATVRGRAGYAWDRVLFYGTGGAAFANVQAGLSGGPFSSSTQAGWTAGAGIEYAFAPNWTAKVEYLFVDLKSASCPVTTCGGGGTTVSFNENVIRGGINYKFSWW